MKITQVVLQLIKDIGFISRCRKGKLHDNISNSIMSPTLLFFSNKCATTTKGQFQIVHDVEINPK